MYGFQAITHYNGWAMAVAGALIVFSGLALLCIVISQLYKLVALWENRGREASAGPEADTAASGADEVAVPSRLTGDAAETARYYRPLIERLDSPFPLRELYQASVENDFPHPHISIRQLREAGFLVARGDGMFGWEESSASIA